MPDRRRIAMMFGMHFSADLPGTSPGMPGAENKIIVKGKGHSE
jgi:hypothetical protein